MKVAWRRAWGSGLVLGFAAWVPFAPESRAAEPAGILVRVDAPRGQEDCITAEAIWRELSRRTNHVRRAERGEASAVVLISVSRAQGGGFSGELTIVRSGVSSEARTLVGGTCEELRHAMSFVAALAFDPAARPEVDVGTLPEPPPAIVPPPKPEALQPPPSSLRSRASLRMGVGASFGAMTVARELTATYGGFADLGSNRGWKPSLRLGIVRTEASISSAPSGVGADLAWTLGRASLCPVRLSVVELGAMAVAPCAGVHAGALSASAAGSGFAKRDHRVRAFVAGGLVGRLEVTPLRPVFIELEGGVAFPFIRDEIAVDPSLSVFRTPGFYGVLEINAGVRFP